MARRRLRTYHAMMVMVPPPAPPPPPIIGYLRDVNGIHAALLSCIHCGVAQSMPCAEFGLPNDTPFRPLSGLGFGSANAATGPRSSECPIGEVGGPWRRLKQSICWRFLRAGFGDPNGPKPASAIPPRYP